MLNFLYKATLLTCLIKLALFCEPPNCKKYYTLFAKIF